MGMHTVYIKYLNGCGIAQQTISVLGVPKFFTPNNDGYYDSWAISGLFYYPKAEIKIMDRFGKLITQLTAANTSWDGTFNGKQLPSDDYWYVYKINKNEPEKKGHFSMKR